MSVDEYATAFTERMKLFPYLVPTELSKIDRFANGLLTDFGPMAKMATTLKTAAREAKNVEAQVREKGLEKDKSGEKRKFEGSSRSKKESKTTQRERGLQSHMCRQSKRREHFK